MGWGGTQVGGGNTGVGNTGSTQSTQSIGKNKKSALHHEHDNRNIHKELVAQSFRHWPGYAPEARRALLQASEEGQASNSNQGSNSNRDSRDSGSYRSRDSSRNKNLSWYKRLMRRIGWGRSGSNVPGTDDANGGGKKVGVTGEKDVAVATDATGFLNSEFSEVGSNSESSFLSNQNKTLDQVYVFSEGV